MRLYTHTIAKILLPKKGLFICSIIQLHRFIIMSDDATTPSPQVTEQKITNVDNSQLIPQPETSFICTYCSKLHKNQDIFCWSDCNHPYSRECVLPFVIQPQLYQNMLPICDKSNCNRYLKNEEAEYILPMREYDTYSVIYDDQKRIHLKYNSNTGMFIHHTTQKHTKCI